MKNLLLILTATIALAIGNTAFGQTKNGLKQSKAEIKTCITNFVKGGDQRDSKLLEDALDENFRAVVNSPQSVSLQTLDRKTYFLLIEGGKIGGDQRKIEIESIDIYNNLNAIAKVKLTGSKATFYNYYTLARVNDKWVLVQDLLEMRS